MSDRAHALARVRRVRVGTTNAPKIAAATGALAPYAPQARVEGAAVASGVSEQPIGYGEIARGACNRATRAFELGDCELAVGYEDGLVDLPELSECGVASQGAGTLMNIGCAAVTDGSTTSLGLSSGFAYPPALAARAVREQTPIGDLFDALWHDYDPSAAGAAKGGEPSALHGGNIGKLSLEVLTRSEYARHAIACALVRFLHPRLYADPSEPGEGVATVGSV